MAVLRNGTNHFDSDTANLFINDMKKQGGGTETDGFPLNTYIFSDFALFLYIYKRKEKEDGEGSGSG